VCFDGGFAESVAPELEEDKVCGWEGGAEEACEGEHAEGGGLDAVEEEDAVGRDFCGGGCERWEGVVGCFSEV